MAFSLSRLSSLVHCNIISQYNFHYFVKFEGPTGPAHAYNGLYKLRYGRPSYHYMYNMSHTHIYMAHTHTHTHIYMHKLGDDIIWPRVNENCPKACTYTRQISTPNPLKIYILIVQSDNKNGGSVLGKETLLSRQRNGPRKLAWETDAAAFWKELFRKTTWEISSFSAASKRSWNWIWHSLNIDSLGAGGPVGSLSGG